MALQYTILLALAFAAVAVAQSEEKKGVVTPSSQESTTKKNNEICTKDEQTKIQSEWINTLACFSQALTDKPDAKTKCKSFADILGHNKTLTEAFSCVTAGSIEKKKKVVKNIGVVWNMMNVTVTDYKDTIKTGHFAKCMSNNNKIKLKDCVKTNVHGKNNTVVNKLGNFTFEKVILSLDLNNNAAKEKMKNIEECVTTVFNGIDECKCFLNYTHDLFKAASSSSIPISSLVIMIGAALIALYL